MCGIHGIIKASKFKEGQKIYDPNFGKGERDFIQSGFVAGSLRGMDSSGIFQLDKKLQPFMHKLPIMGPIFIEDKGSRQFINDVSSSPLTLCHVRAATEGKVSLNNAHPFMVERDDGTSLIGVHNGTLSNWRSKAGRHAVDFSVDSEWALSHIADEGADAFEAFEGAYSFVWWDEKNPTRLMFARNKERPMLFLRTEDKKSILFASEAGMLSWLARRHEVKVEKEIYFSNAGHMYSIDFNADELEWKDLGILPEKKVVAVVNNASTAAGRSARERDDDDADNWYGRHYDNYGSTMGGYTQNGYQYSSSYRSESRLDVIKEVNDALRKARDKRLGFSKTSESTVAEGPKALIGTPVKTLLDQAAEAQLLIDAGEDEADPFGVTANDATAERADDDNEAILEYHAKGGKFVQIAQNDWFEIDTASKEEIADAKEASWFGEMVVVEPTIYEQGTGEVLMDVPDDVDDNVVFMGIMRGFDEVAFTKVLEGRRMHAVIIGSGLDEQGMNQFILAPLNLKGEEALMKIAN